MKRYWILTFIIIAIVSFSIGICFSVFEDWEDKETQQYCFYDTPYYPCHYEECMAYNFPDHESRIINYQECQLEELRDELSSMRDANCVNSELEAEK